jgi:hypothetical protein
VEKYGTARQATNDNIKQHMHFACWITEATDTHSEYVILTVVFHSNHGYMSAPQCYVTCKLPVLFKIYLITFAGSLTMMLDCLHKLLLGV